MGKALLWSREKGRRGGGRALLDGLGKMELIAVGVEPAGRWRAAALLPLEGHWIITLGVGEERQADRETEMKCLRLYFSSGLENHLFQSILLLWESTGLSDGRVRAGAFSFSQATSSILYVAADDKRYHQLAPEKRMDLRLFVEPAATPASALLLWQNYHSTFMVIFEMTGLWFPKQLVTHF